MSIRASVPPKNLTEFGHDRLRDLTTDLGQPRYRADQIYRWIFQRGARDFEAMTDLPRALRQRFVDDGYCIGRIAIHRVDESVDGTRKIAFRLDDGACIESVLIPMEPGRFTQCVSSQVGCAIGCTFCLTATLGLARHLSPGEIVDQVIRAREILPEGARVTHIVYMGMGEPLHNFDGVVASLDPICNEDGLGYVHRKVTISTSGLVPQIEKLGEILPVNLAISLNASTDAVRDALMPINKRYPIATLMAALRRYPLPPRRKLTIEYVLLGGVNDTDADAQRLAQLLRGLPARVNILPWNAFEGPRFVRPDETRVRQFQRILLDRGLTVTVRTSRGRDISAACGQLGARPEAS